MIDTQEIGPPPRQVPDGPGPCFANAYAIAYRLLGERDRARATAEAVAATYLDVEADDASGWLADLATDAVTASLLAADAPLHLVAPNSDAVLPESEHEEPEQEEPEQEEPEHQDPQLQAPETRDPEPGVARHEAPEPDGPEPEPQPAPERQGPEEAGGAGSPGSGTTPPRGSVDPAPGALGGTVPAEAPESPSVAEQRRFLRRRLSTLDGRARAAAALRHLAGYDAPRVAAFMGTDVDDVDALAAPLAPPPGSSWRGLGDPIVRGEAPTVRRRRRHRHLPWKSLLAALTVVALVVLASRMTGPRPRLGRLDPGAGDRAFGTDVDAIASSGCVVAEESPPEPGVTAESIDAPGGSAAFRLRTPSDPTEPAPLLVVLPGYGQTAEQFAAVAQIEGVDDEALVATLEPPAPALEWNAGGDPAGSDDRTATIAVTEELIVSRCVDLSRVHLVGFGPGGQLAGAVACAAPEVFASTTMVGGASMPDHCLLRPDVAALLTANVDDPVIRPTGGYGPGADAQPGTGSFQRPVAEPMDDLAQRWAAAVGADEEATRAEADDTLVRTWTGDNGVEVLSVLHPAGGHAWGMGDTVALIDFLDRSARSG